MTKGPLLSVWQVGDSVKTDNATNTVKPSKKVQLLQEPQIVYLLQDENKASSLSRTQL